MSRRSRKTKTTKVTRSSKFAKPTKRKKPTKVLKSEHTREPREPTAPPRRTCSMCHEPHEGDSEESFDSLAVLDPEAVVYYDRDVVGLANVDGLCGPRFRQNVSGLYAHYVSPGGARYVVYQWKLDDKRWEMIIEVLPDREKRVAAGGTP